jgi:Flp pilus assembly pilin Flp
VITLLCSIHLRFVANRSDTERGASLVEYALLVALIAVVCIAVLAFMGGAAESKFSEVGSRIAGA